MVEGSQAALSVDFRQGELTFACMSQSATDEDEAYSPPSGQVREGQENEDQDLRADDGVDAVEAADEALNAEPQTEEPQEDSSTQPDDEESVPKVPPVDFLTKLKIAELEKKVADYESKISGIRDYVKNLETEMDAARKRAQRDQEKQIDLKVSQALRDILPVVDNLDRSVKAAAEDKSSLAEGVRLVSRQFQEALQRQGLEKIVAKGEPFNPEFHEALTTLSVPDPAMDQVVLEEVQTGYRYKGSLLRPAQVVVGKISDPS